MKSPAPTNLTRIILAAALLLALPAAALATPVPPPDLSGIWDLTSQLFLPQAVPPALGETPCDFAGSAEITQGVEGDFMGTADLTLLSGPEGCPAEMSADVSGVVSGNGTIEGAMLTGAGNLGTAFFSGEVGPDGDAVGGDSGVETGPFGGASGTWAAIIGAGPSVLEIPTVTAFGLVLLIALLAASALFMVRRRPAV